MRELKSSLSRYLSRVRAGETVVITQRGEPIARIVPAGIPQDIAELISQGRVAWTGRRFEVPQEPVRLTEGPGLSEYISEDRG